MTIALDLPFKPCPDCGKAYRWRSEGERCRPCAAAVPTTEPRRKASQQPKAATKRSRKPRTRTRTDSRALNVDRVVRMLSRQPLRLDEIGHGLVIASNVNPVGEAAVIVQRLIDDGRVMDLDGGQVYCLAGGVR